MKLRYFGDSYDIVKKSLLGWLAGSGPWSAHPMFTHATSGREALEFARFLGVPLVSVQVLTPESDRLKYFAPCNQCQNLFLDPDIGLRLRAVAGRRAPEYVFAAELVELARARPEWLTMTFDQSLPRGREDEQIWVKLLHFRERGLDGFAYASHASFMVIGQAALVRESRKALLAESRLPAHRLLI